ncbi:MAG: HDIG domain-containing metalloprotein [Oscillospiraceae bacterium]
MIAEFYLHIRPLLEHPQVQELGNYIQHNCHSRLNHCLDVAYFSFFIAKLLGWDSKSAARGGLLHDLFLYDRKKNKEEAHRHLRRHPITALENARKICTLNKVEEDIIRRHMWLITLVPPRYKEGYIVTFVDKYCALREAIISHRNSRRALALAAAGAA